MSEIQFHCSICSHRGPFLVEAGVSKRDNFRCANCRAMARQRDLAQIILDEFGCGLHIDLRRLVESGGLDDLDIYEVGMIGPIANRLKGLPRYVQSYFWDDTPLGTVRNGVVCQDLRALTFKDESFDLILSMDVLEHVFDMPKVLSEVARVLKPDGVHIFTIPVVYPFPAASSIRAVMTPSGDIEHRMPERYHAAGNGSKALVVTEWGADLVGLHQQSGLRLSVIRRSAPSVDGLSNATFVARRLATTAKAAASAKTEASVSVRLDAAKRMTKGRH